MNGDSLSTSTRTSIVQPTTTGKPRVDLVKSDFDALITQKGYRVYHDKALKCPCRNVTDGQGQSSCKNCGGSGWIFMNRSETKMVIQSMNKDTKFLEWSEEKMGTAKITKRNEEDLAYMDRLILIDVLSIHNQVLFPKVYDDDVLRAKTIYGVREIMQAFLFVDTTTKLQPLTLGVDFSIEEECYIVLSEEFKDIEHPTISIKYKYNPTYHVVDFSRGSMNTFMQNRESGGVDTNVEMPLSAVAKVAHYIIDEQNLGGTALFDNTVVSQCSQNKTINIGGIVKSVPTITQDQKSEFQAQGTLIFNSTTLTWEGWNGTEWVVIDNKIADLWSQTDW